ncbi:hypothetical protein HOY82DRAFT_541866 [Tuber indicum]|nr:hypothetical protein HOY82DRAFT_541866 [Tuber indicum]
MAPNQPFTHHCHSIAALSPSPTLLSSQTLSPSSPAAFSLLLGTSASHSVRRLALSPAACLEDIPAMPITPSSLALLCMPLAPPSSVLLGIPPVSHLLVPLSVPSAPLSPMPWCIHPALPSSAPLCIPLASPVVAPLVQQRSSTPERIAITSLIRSKIRALQRNAAWSFQEIAKENGIATSTIFSICSAPFTSKKIKLGPHRNFTAPVRKRLIDFATPNQQNHHLPLAEVA